MHASFICRLGAVNSLQTAAGTLNFVLPVLPETWMLLAFFSTACSSLRCLLLDAQSCSSLRCLLLHCLLLQNLDAFSLFVHLLSLIGHLLFQDLDTFSLFVQLFQCALLLTQTRWLLRLAWL